MSRLRSNRLLARASRWLLLQDVTSYYVPRLTPEVLLRAGLPSGTKVLDLKGRLRCRGCGRKGGR